MKDKELFRTAARVQEALLQLRQSYYLECLRRMTLLSQRLGQVSSESRKLQLAMTKEWSAASEKCCTRAQKAVSEIPHFASRIQEIFSKKRPESPTLSGMIEELRAVEQEFGEVHVKTQDKSISVTTEPVTLEGMYLGSFQIMLFIELLPRMYNSTPYSVYAVEPNPASTDSSITHPHVSGDTLCEGEGHAAIRAALEAGRLSDFFVLIRSTLSTYNPGSAYVSLEDWDGIACHECGYTMHSDEMYFCISCDREFCDECSTCCEQCHETICIGCAEHCEVCEDALCWRCKRQCSECERVCCESCLEEGICSDCREEKENDHEEETNEQRQEEEPQPAECTVRLAG